MLRVDGGWTEGGWIWMEVDRGGMWVDGGWTKGGPRVDRGRMTVQVVFPGIVGKVCAYLQLDLE